MTTFTTVNQATEAQNALQEFVRRITQAVQDGEIKVIEGTDAFTQDGIAFALDYHTLFITRCEQDGGVLTITLDLGDDEYVQYSVLNGDVESLLNS